MRTLHRFSPHAHALLRIVTGFLFAFHGVQKVFGFLAPSRPPLLSQIGLGGVIELLCGLAVLLGVQTRAAAFLASGTMAVAYVQFHWRLQLGRAFFPAINEGEPALLYAFIFLYLACAGGGIWSLAEDR